MTHAPGWAPRGATTTKSMWREERKISPGRATNAPAGTIASTVTMVLFAARTARRSDSSAEQTT
ncbi:MAG: hypothetical protein C3F14_02390, partial [Deltaproteobacteria bacterium]